MSETHPDTLRTRMNLSDLLATGGLEQLAKGRAQLAELAPKIRQAEVALEAEAVAAEKKRSCRQKATQAELENVAELNRRLEVLREELEQAELIRAEGECRLEEAEGLLRAVEAAQAHRLGSEVRHGATIAHHFGWLHISAFPSRHPPTCSPVVPY
eukprot:SAG11_NODE_7580_length_1126_cov_1.038948_2_plen_156_part_00